MKQFIFVDCLRMNMVSKYKLVVVREEFFFYNISIRNVLKVVEFLKRYLRFYQELEEVFIVVVIDLQLNLVVVFEVVRGIFIEV